MFLSAGVIHPNLKGGLLQAQHEWITSVTEFGNVIHIRSDISIGIGSGSMYFECIVCIVHTYRCWRKWNIGAVT